MDLFLKRAPSTAACTLGRLYVNDVFECFTLEDVVRQGPKVRGKTAIPAGRYQVANTFSDRFQRYLPLLLNVPGFKGIRIHPGNTAADTLGCILVGETQGEDAIGNSRRAFNALFARLKAVERQEKIWITIENA